ncbi:MAG: EpsG family protein [Clostridia bacterium]|nr:EpsG family protein [Clostridia bacterium]
MRELLPIFIICISGALLTDMLSLYDHENKEYVHKVKFFFVIITLIAAVFCGLRISYNDTYSYRHLYDIVDTTQPFFADFSWQLSESTGFKMVYKAMAYMGWDVQLFLMAFALFDVGVFFWFVFKYSRSYTLSVFLLFATGVYTFCFAAIMQCTATAFALIGVDLFFRRRPVGFLLFVLIGCSFHTYCFIYFIIPLMVSQPWHQRTYAIIAATLIVAILFTGFIRLVIGITSATGEQYTVDSFTSEGVNVIRVLVSFVTPLLSYLVRDDLKKSDDKVMNVAINLCIVHACIMFLGLFGTANYFARLANYFLVFQCIALPYLVDRFFSNEQSGFLSVKTIMVTGYTGYFIYGTGMVNGGFDALFSGITIGDFLSLFSR